jgi:hypothetical protein
MPSYRIRGLDGREYGPVEQDKLTQWAREGRIVAQMMVCPESTGVWVTAGSLPELASALGGSAPSGTRETFGPGTLAAEQGANAGPPKNQTPNLTVGNCFGKAWNLLDLTFVLQVFIASWLMHLVPLILPGPFIVGILRCALRKVDGKKYEFKDMFSGFDQFGDSLVGFLLYFAATSVAMCCPPVGIFIYIKLWFWGCVVADRPGRSGLDALQDSWNLTTGNVLDFLVLGIVGICAILAGLLACVVGVYVAIPIVVLATAVAYRELTPRPAEG